MGEGRIFYLDLLSAKPVFRVMDCVQKYSPDIVGNEGIEDKDPASGQKGRDYMKGRVFGRGADQGDKPCLHMRQKGVLLGLVKAVDLINKENSCRRVFLLSIFCLSDNLANLLHA